MQKILLLPLTKQFLDKGANLPPIQIRCENSPPVDIGLTFMDAILVNF